MNISSFDIKEKFKSVKNVVMQVTPVEAKVRACTSNDPWGAKSTDKSEVAEATYNFEDYKIVMQTIWKRMSDTGKDWRHVYKALQLLEYLIVHGSERVHEEAKDSLYTIRSLRSFRYVDEKGKDYGEGIRELAKKMVKFIQDEKQVQEEREKAKALSGKYSGFSRAESRYQGGSKSRSQPRQRYDEEEDRPQRKKTYDDDEEDDRPQRRPQSRPTHRDDDEDDSPPVQRKPQRNIFEGDEEDSYSTRRQEPPRQDSRREDTSARPRAPSNGAPQSNVRKPRPPSPDFEAPPQRTTTTTQKPQAKSTAGVADFFGPSQDSFFDDDNFVQGGGQQQGGFNPRTGGQQQQDFDANFDNNDFNDDFPEDEFGTYKGGEAPEKKDNLFSITEGLVNFDLNDTKKPSQGGQTGGTLQPTNASTGSNQPLTLSQKAKLQGKKIPTTTNIGRGAPTGMLPPQGGGFGGMPPQGGGFGGMPPQGGGFGGMPPQGGGFGGMPPQGGGFGGMPPQGGGFGGQPQYPPMGRGVPPQGGGFGGMPQGGGFGGQPQGGFNQGFGGQPQGGFGGQPQGGFNQGFGGQPQGGGRGQPQYGNQPQGMGRGAPQNRPPVMNNNDPFF